MTSAVNKVNVRVFISLFLVIIIDTIGVGLVFPVLSPLVLEPTSTLVDPITSISTRDMLYGGIIGIFSLFLLIGAPLLGDLSDSIGRKRALLICVSGTAISFFLCAAGIWQANLGLLFFGRALNGFTAGSSSIAQAAIADMSTMENKTKNLGLITLANCLGFVLGPILGGYFAEHPGFLAAGFATPFIMAGTLAFINILFLVFFVHDDKKPNHKKCQLQLSLGIRIFIDAIRRKSVRKASLLFLCLQVGWSIYFQFISILLVQVHHYSATQIGVFMTFIGVVFTICLAFLIRLFLKLVSLSTAMRIAFIVLTTSLIICPLIRTEVQQWLITVPITLSVAVLYTGGLTLFSNAVDHTQQGWVMGVSAALAAVAWMFGAAMAGILGQWGVEWPFILAALFTFIGFMLSLRMKEHHHETSNEISYEK